MKHERRITQGHGSLRAVRILSGYLTTYAALLFDSIQHGTFGPITTLIYTTPNSPLSTHVVQLADTLLHFEDERFDGIKRWRKLERYSLTGTKGKTFCGNGRILCMDLGKY